MTKKLQKPFTNQEWEILAALYGQQFCTEFKQFKKRVYTFSSYEGEIPAGAPNYNELLKEVNKTIHALKYEIDAVKNGEIINLGEALDSE